MVRNALTQCRSERDLEVVEKIARCADWYQTQWAVKDSEDRVENEWTGKLVLDTIYVELKIDIGKYTDILLLEEVGCFR